MLRMMPARANRKRARKKARERRQRDGGRLMALHFCVSIRFLQPYSHGRRENGDPEWPPSPLRVMQSLVAASAGKWNERNLLVTAAPAIRWLESLPPPQIIATRAVPSKQPYRLYVPDNVANKVASAWGRGNEASIADYRTDKDVRPAHLDGDAVHYVYNIPQVDSDVRGMIDTLTLASRSITHIGWGIDMAVGNSSLITGETAAQLAGVRWTPSPSGGNPLRTPKAGTMDDLIRRHADSLGRVTTDGFRPVPPLRVFDVVRYRRHDEPLPRPFRVFELRSTDGSWFRYPHRKLVHIAGMLRHLAIEAMSKDPPHGLKADWVEPISPVIRTQVNAMI